MRIVVTIAVVALGGIAGVVFAAPAPLAQPAVATVSAALTPPPPRYRTTSHEVAAGDNAGSVLRSMGAPAADLLAGAGSALNNIFPGDQVRLDWRDGEDRPFRLRLAHDPATTTELVWTGARYTARKVPVPYRVEEQAAAITVTSSLWSAAIAVGFSAGQIIELAKIFEYDVDFNTELVAGARFRLVLDRLTADDGSARIGDIRAVILDNGKKQYVAIRHRTHDGTAGWYGKDGASRRKAFLRSPIEFSRVSSGFSAGRYHPILHRMRAHRGVDLAAPSGTPIRAVADGVVTKAGWAGGHGNHIELRHDNGTVTGYSHLSSIGVKRGAHVSQGQTIGKVGSTGQSTGPHLHYEYLVNGVHKDPMKAIVPVQKPLEASERTDFFAVRDRVLPLLETTRDLAPPEGSVENSALER
ncbi:MAG: hypothetical protein EXR71_05940 [Myxococcales bacterium]|nr:hypothetical protein [Myxococcales bacterium]